MKVPPMLNGMMPFLLLASEALASFAMYTPALHDRVIQTGAVGGYVRGRVGIRSTHPKALFYSIVSIVFYSCTGDGDVATSTGNVDEGFHDRRLLLVAVLLAHAVRFEAMARTNEAIRPIKALQGSVGDRAHAYPTQSMAQSTFGVPRMLRIAAQTSEWRLRSMMSQPMRVSYIYRRGGHHVSARAQGRSSA